MLVKKEKVDELKDYIDYMTGENFERLLKQNHLHSMRNSLQDKILCWLDCNYIFEVKIPLEKHKEKLNQIFKNALNG